MQPHQFDQIDELLGRGYLDNTNVRMLADYVRPLVTELRVVTVERDRLATVLDQRTAALRKALEKYGTHESGCGGLKRGLSRECTCGLTAAMLGQPGSVTTVLHSV